jgi:hypothetical protein
MARVMYLDNIVQDLFTRLRAPLIVLDAGMELVAHSVHDDVEHDAAQVAMIVSRRGTTGAIASFERYQVKYSTEPVRIPGKDGGKGHIVVTLRSAGQPTGYLTFPDVYGESIPAEKAAAVEAAASRLGEALRERMLDRRRGKEHVRQLMGDLLSDDEHRHAYAVREVAAGRLLAAAPRYSVLLLAAGPHGGPPDEESRLVLEAAVGRMAQAAPRCMATLVREEGVVVVPGVLGEGALAALITEHGLEALCAGAGGAVEGLAGIRASHRQARIALDGARRDPDRAGRSAAWTDLGEDRLLYQLPFDSMGPEDLPLPVQRLLAARNAPMLMESLRAYLDAGGNAVEASRRLHVHRSTLYYRLDRATKLAGIDLADGQVQRELHLALRVAGLLGAAPAVDIASAQLQ